MPHINKTSADPTELTSFDPPKDENATNSSSILQYFLNLFTSKKALKDQRKTCDEKEQPITARPNVLDLQKASQTSQRKVSKTASHLPGSEVEFRLRSFSAILRDFPKLMRGPQDQNPGGNEDDDPSPARSLRTVGLRQYWMPDEQCHECYECGEKFTTFRRRHHCRICGQIFCSRCCNQLISGKIMGVSDMLRSCTYCCKLVLMFAEGNTPKSVMNTLASGAMAGGGSNATVDELSDEYSSAIESVLYGGIHPLHGNSQGIAQSNSITSLKRKSQTPAPYGHDVHGKDDSFFSTGPFESALPSKDPSGWQTPMYLFDASPADVATTGVAGNDVTDDLVKDSSQLHALWRKIHDERQGVEFRDHRFRLRKYSNCITGQELIDWLIRNDVASTRTQGCAIGQALFKGKWLKPVVDIGRVFQDGYVLFRSGRRPSKIAFSGNRIEIYPDHFANFPDETDSLQTLQTAGEPTWVREINNCGEQEANIGAVASNRDVSGLNWSSDIPIAFNESLLYSDEDQSASVKSVISLSSFVEIEEGNDVIKYTRPKSMDDLSSASGPQRSADAPLQPTFDDSCLTSISADYLRNIITWNGTVLNQPWISPSPGWRESDLLSARVASQDKRAFHWLREMYLRHNLTFLRQLLSDKGLDLAWAEVLLPLAKHAVEHITPDPSVSMNVCHYFQIKKVPDGPRNESQIVNGVVCTKNVVHKQMRTDITDPAILLLAIPLEYQRVQLKLSALDPIVRQEREFYKHLVSRITARQPHVVLVQRTVSHITQELILQEGITLVINVKPSVMERIARCTEADIVYSIDQLLQAKLGSCSRFFVKHHFIPSRSFPSSEVSGACQTTKTLMYFTGCNPVFGCTAILRRKHDRASRHRNASEELVEVKHILRFLARAMFHARLELSYLIDQHGFGKLLKKHSTSKSYPSDPEGTAKQTETDQREDRHGVISNELRKLKCAVEDVNSADSDMEDERSIALRRKVPSAPPRGDTSMVPDDTVFADTLKLLLLSVSPLIQPRLPFLFVPQNRNSSNLQFLRKKLFWSRLFEAESSASREKPSSTVDANLKTTGRSRANTVGSLVVQGKMWLSPSHQSHKNLSSSEHEGSASSVETLDNNPGSREILDDGNVAPVPAKERPDPHASCYSQLNKPSRSEGVRGSSEVSVSSRSNVDATKLHTWEQKLVDIIFGPPVATSTTDKREKFVLSPNYTPRGGPTHPGERRGRYASATDLNSTFNEATSAAADVKLSGPSRPPPQLHEFVTCSLNESASFESVRDLLASYRASVGVHGDAPDLTAVSPIESFNVQQPEAFENTPSRRLATSRSMNKRLLPLDCMDPANHQQICALFSSYSPQSPNAPDFCVLPWVVDIDFYCGNDITLGGFLERYCFRQSYDCPNATCRRPMVEHVRSFSHGKVCMTIVLKELSKPFNQSSILTWNWNYLTRKSSDIKTMSHDAWSMSFAKYLELRLEHLVIPECRCSPHYQKGLLKQDIFSEEWELKPFTCHQYFLFRDLVAAFKCFPIDIYEVVFPASKLSDFNRDCALCACQISIDIEEDIVTYRDYQIATDLLVETVFDTVRTILDCIQESQNRKYSTENLSEEVSAAREKFYSDFQTALNEGRVHLTEELDFIKMLLNTNAGEALQDDIEADVWDEDKGFFKVHDLPLELANEVSEKILHLKCDICEMVQTWNEKLAEAHEKDRSSYWTTVGKTKTSDISPRIIRRQTVDFIPKVPEESVHEGNLDVGGVSVSQSVMNTQTETVAEQQDLSVLSSSYEQPSVIDSKSLTKFKKTSVAHSKSVEKSTSSKRFSKTGSSMKLLVTRLLPGNALVPSVSMPFPADEHFLLPECRSTNIVVRDAEPSSIIAYTLSSKDYKLAVAAFASDTSDSETSMSSFRSRLTTKSEELDGSPAVITIEDITHETKDAKDDAGFSLLSTPSNSPHIEIQFSDTTSRFYCKVYFATLFEDLRSKILEYGEDQYLASLSRSVIWMARGGKSGSTFHKTKDDQFILKQMSYFELQSFLEFAPKYVDYISKCLEAQEATAISKILGVYRISFRNSETSRSLKRDVVVIENLFYRKKIKQIFDLKGSVRNRHVKASASKEAPEVGGGNADQNDIVLQDENFLKMMCENPIYVHEHTKHLLMSAINRDAEFLSHHLIMDYSLLVGVEEDDKIVVGIIDFIRTFTWDKKLEMVVKWSSSRSMPTVVSPELYKNRFCEAMGRYFQVVPDRWYGMHAY